jgi:hypothetical protein
MNKINPIYIFSLTLIIMLFSVAQLNTAYSLLKTNKQENIQYLKLANEYKKLKITWTNNNTKEKVMAIIEVLHIRDIKINENNNILSIKMRNSNPNIIDKFVNKLLNSAIVINSFKITKNSFKMEIHI